MLEVAKYRLSSSDNIRFSNYFAEDLQFEENSFDHIICLNSFHYYVDQHSVINQFKRVLKPGGTIWIQDWNRVGLFKIANKLIDWLSPENINTRSVDEMKELLHQNNFVVKKEGTWRFRWWNFFFIRAELTNPQ